MFFGKPAEEIDVEDLEDLLAKLFEAKVSPLSARGEKIANDVNTEMGEFIEAVEDFRSSNIEPDSEDLYISNLSSIRVGKASYANALKQAVHAIELSSEGTTYERYSLFLAELKAMIEKVMKVNASFRTVFFAYANGLKRMKEHFSRIEDSSSRLERELERYSEDFGAYTQARNEIRSLLAMLKEKESIEARKVGKLDGQDFGLEKLEEELSKSRERISDLDRKIANIKGAMQSTLAPLHRLSKKFDHLSGKNLHIIIEDPSTMKNERDYAEFIKLLNELKGYIEGSKIEGSGHEVERLLKYDMLSDLKELHALESALAEERRRERRIADEISEKREKARRIEEIAMEEEERKQRISHLNEQIAKKKEYIESLFLQYYGKRIKIRIRQV